MEIDLSQLGNRLIELRKKNNITQQEMSEKIQGLTVQMISGYEKGRQKPGIENLIKISNFFNVSLDYLCKGVSNDSNIVVDSTSKAFEALIKIEQSGLLKRQNDLVYNSVIFRLNGEKYLEFFMKYQKLLDAREILGEDMYNEALNNLISKVE